LRHLTIPKQEWVDGSNYIARYSLLGVVFSHALWSQPWPVLESSNDNVVTQLTNQNFYFMSILHFF
jgi:hypothetical protein